MVGQPTAMPLESEGNTENLNPQLHSLDASYVTDQISPASFPLHRFSSLPNSGRNVRPSHGLCHTFSRVTDFSLGLLYCRGFLQPYLDNQCKPWIKDRTIANTLYVSTKKNKLGNDSVQFCSVHSLLITTTKKPLRLTEKVMYTKWVSFFFTPLFCSGKYLASSARHAYVNARLSSRKVFVTACQIRTETAMCLHT